jgi:hypothetical protein
MRVVNKRMYKSVTRMGSLYRGSDGKGGEGRTFSDMDVRPNILPFSYPHSLFRAILAPSIYGI